MIRQEIVDDLHSLSHMLPPKSTTSCKGELSSHLTISQAVGHIKAATSLHSPFFQLRLQRADFRYSDTGSNRALIGDYYSDGSKMTDESCIAYCSGKKYAIAGTEYSQECFCSNVIGGGSIKAPDGDCNMGCSGNSTEACGGPNRLTIFENPAAIPVHDPGPNGWTFIGCYT